MLVVQFIMLHINWWHLSGASSERHAPYHFQGVCRKALAGQLVVHGAWLHAPTVASAQGQLASGCSLG